VSGGIIIDSSTWNSVRNVSTTHVIVDAGIQWRDVLAVTLPLGLTPPVLPDYLGLSVGGTLAVGGLGGTSAIYGAQADNVESLELVLLNGDTVDCSATRNPGLFHNTLCGLGQCALITRAELKLVRAPTKVRRFKLSYRDVCDLVFDQDLLLKEGRFDYLEGQIYADETGSWHYVLEAGQFLDSFENPNNHNLLEGLRSDGNAIEITELSYLEFLERMEPSVARFKITGEWDYSHPWLNLFLPASETTEFVKTTIEALRPEEIGASGVLLLYPLKRSNFQQTMLRVPKEDMFFLFAILRAVPSDSKSIKDIILDNGSLYHKAKSIGGEMYPVGTIGMTHRDWMEHFGEVWPMLRLAKDRYDRDRLLAPGQGIFPGDQDET
jgi:cytokinin dehydrogenase